MAKLVPKQTKKFNFLNTMEQSGSLPLQLCDNLKNILKNNADNTAGLASDWKSFQLDIDSSVQAPQIDYEVIELLACRIKKRNWNKPSCQEERSVVLQMLYYIFIHYEIAHDTLDECSGQVFELFPYLILPVVDVMKLMENLGLNEQLSPFSAVIVLFESICTASEFYAESSVANAILQWIIAEWILNADIIPTCRATFVKLVAEISCLSREVSEVVIHYGVELAKVATFPCVLLQFHTVHLLRSALSSSLLLIQKSEEWFPKKSHLFANIASLQDNLDFVHSMNEHIIPNRQVMSYVCEAVFLSRLDQKFNFSPPAKMWVDFMPGMKYLGFFFKPVSKQNPQVWDSPILLPYLLLTDQIVERAEVEQTECPESQEKFLDLTLILEMTIRRLIDAPTPEPKANIITIRLKYHPTIVEVIRATFNATVKALKNFGVSFPLHPSKLSHTRPYDSNVEKEQTAISANETPGSVYLAGNLGSASSDTSLSHTPDPRPRGNWKIFSPEMEVEHTATTLDNEIPDSLYCGRNVVRHSTLSNAELSKRTMFVSEVNGAEMKQGGPKEKKTRKGEKEREFWYLEIPTPPPWPRFIGKPMRRKVEASPDNDEGIEDETEDQEPRKDYLFAKLESTDLNLTALFIENGGRKWAKVFRQQIEKKRRTSGSGDATKAVKTFREIFRKLEELDVNKFFEENEPSSEIRSKAMKLIQMFSEVKAEGKEFL